MHVALSRRCPPIAHRAVTRARRNEIPIGMVSRRGETAPPRRPRKPPETAQCQFPCLRIAKPNDSLTEQMSKPNNIKRACPTSVTDLGSENADSGYRLKEKDAGSIGGVFCRRGDGSKRGRLGPRQPQDGHLFLSSTARAHRKATG